MTLLWRWNYKKHDFVNKMELDALLSYAISTSKLISPFLHSTRFLKLTTLLPILNGGTILGWAFYVRYGLFHSRYIYDINTNFKFSIVIILIGYWITKYHKFILNPLFLYLKTCHLILSSSAHTNETTTILQKLIQI